jgi:hypothetical protein
MIISKLPATTGIFNLGRNIYDGIFTTQSSRIPALADTIATKL